MLGKDGYCDICMYDKNLYISNPNDCTWCFVDSCGEWS